MTDRKSKIENMVQAALSDLEHSQPRQAGPWFQTRVMARINHLKEHQRSNLTWSWGWRLLRPVAIAAILLLNLTLTLHTWTQDTESSDHDQDADPITILAVEYGYQSNSETLTWAGE